jgi:hypothetical protein
LTPDTFTAAGWLDARAEDLARAVADVPHGNTRRKAVLDVVGKLRARACAIRDAERAAAPSPVGELVALARLVASMRRAQRSYFERRKAMPHVSHAAELRLAQKAEDACEAAVRDALARHQQTLPGMGSGEGGDPA